MVKIRRHMHSSGGFTGEQCSKILVTLTTRRCHQTSRWDDATGLPQYCVHPIIRELTAFDARQVGCHVCPLSLQSLQKLARNLLRNDNHPRTICRNEIGGINDDTAAADREIDLTWPTVKRPNRGS